MMFTLNFLPECFLNQRFRAPPTGQALGQVLSQMLLVLPAAAVGGIISHLKDEKIEMQRVHLTNMMQPERSRSTSQATGFWTGESPFRPHHTAFGVASHQRKRSTTLKNELSGCILIPPP